MNAKIIIGIVLAVFLGFALPGCESPPNLAPSGAMGDPYMAPTQDPQIAILSPELRQWFGFHPARVRRTPTDTLEIEIPVRNLTSRAYNIDYRILFYDDQDMMLEPTMGWEFLRVLPRQTVRLQRKSLSADASYYRAEIKWAR